MKGSFKQSKRDKEVTITLKISFYDLLKLYQSMADSQIPIVKEFIAVLDVICDEVEEPS